jgi:hypothetical protein
VDSAPLSPRKQRLSEIVEQVGQKMADAFVSAVEVRTSQAWQGNLPKISAAPQPSVPPAVPQESPRTVATPPEDDEPTLTPPQTVKPRQDNAWTSPVMPVIPATQMTAPPAPAIRPTASYSEIPFQATPPAPRSSLGIPSAPDRVPAPAFGLPVPPSVPASAPLGYGPQANPPPAPAMRSAVDTFRQAAIAPTPEPGFRSASVASSRDGAEAVTQLLSKIIEKLDRAIEALGEGDESETVQNKKRELWEEGASEPAAMGRNLAPMLGASASPTRPHNPAASAMLGS